MSGTTKRTLTVDLTPELAARIQRALENGDYGSDAEIVLDALHLWEQRKDPDRLDLERLKQAYAKGKASGEGQSIDRAAFLSELKAERAARG